MINIQQNRTENGKRHISLQLRHNQLTGHGIEAIDDTFEARLLRIPTMQYTDPWSLLYEERLASLAKGDFRVAYFYDVPNTPTFRYRVYNMIQVLQESNQRISASYFTASELSRLNTMADLADVFVICRFQYSEEINRLVVNAQSRGTMVFFDVDDLVIDPRYLDILLQTIDQEHNPGARELWRGSLQRMEATLRICDAAITTNNYLASKIRESTGKTVYVAPNFLNKEQISISNSIIELKRNNLFTRGWHIYLGYFSGSPVHNKDFAIISDHLASLFRKDPRIMLVIVGHLQLKGDILNYLSRIRFYPIQDFINLQRLIGAVDINLAPLQNNPITNSKSELKYFEAGIVGTVTAASRTFAYADAIHDSDNGYLCEISEWENTLLRIINAPDNAKVAENARIYSEQRYAWYNQIDLLESIFLT